MPPKIRTGPAKKKTTKFIASNKPSIQAYMQKFLQLFFLFDHFHLTSVLILVLELFLNVFIINRVSYTEIDWKAYMQEVEGFLNGSLDYSQLKGDTGPLVYPAGFVYIFTILYWITNYGQNIRIAQYLFCILYVCTLYTLYRIYSTCQKVPPYVLILCCLTAYRIHSIYVLRLFNDPVAVLLFYVSLNLFLSSKWNAGSICYSLAVSVKMNILLYAPALLIAYLVLLGFKKTITQLAICASVQLIIGLPFLYSNPIAYIRQSFDLGRVFFYKWTVNWRFIPEDVFLNFYFHIILLAIHISLLAYFTPIMWRYFKSYKTLKQLQSEVEPQLKYNESINMGSLTQLFLLPFFISNFIGIVCSRSLHYQFYVWYYHTLPFILWSTTFSNKFRLLLLGVIELCWNTYPSTRFSSICLFLSHTAILSNLIRKFKNKNSSKQID